MTRLARLRLRARGAAVVALAAAALLVAAVAIPGSAVAFWSASTAAGSAGSAGSASVNAGATPTPVVSNKSNVAVSWAASTLSNGVAATGYTVSRTNVATGVAQTVLAGCAGTLTALSCTETGVPDGRWRYAVTPRFQNWAGAASADSVVAITDTTAPTNVITLGSVTGGASKSGSTVYYRGGGMNSGSFTLVNAMTDAGSGPASSATGTLSGTTIGWTHTPSTVSTPAGGPFVSNTFSWMLGATASPTVGVAGLDAYGNTAATTLTFVNDSTAPGGGAISYPDGGTNASSVTVTVGAITDAGSGAAGGTRTVQRATATLTGTTCGGFTAFTNLGVTVADPTVATPIATPVTAGTCYRYQYVFTDAVGNSTTTTSTAVVKAKSSAAAVSGTPGLVSWYRLSDTGTTTTDSVGTNSGTQSGPTPSSPGAITGNGDGALLYDGVDDYNRVGRNIGGTFSVELWFKTTQSKNSGATVQWYNGMGLVDAETPGNQNDFGIALYNGRVIAGVGNTDQSVATTAFGTYADNAWHHVVMTRTQGGAMTLYVDGVSIGSVTSNANVLNASANIDFGRLQTGINYFAGNLDEISFYSTALTQAQVQAHYAAGNPL